MCVTWRRRARFDELAGIFVLFCFHHHDYFDDFFTLRAIFNFSVYKMHSHALSVALFLSAIQRLLLLPSPFLGQWMDWCVSVVWHSETICPVSFVGFRIFSKETDHGLAWMDISLWLQITIPSTAQLYTEHLTRWWVLYICMYIIIIYILGLIIRTTTTTLLDSYIHGLWYWSVDTTIGSFSFARYYYIM